MLFPKVSIVIVNYNGEKLLEKCLESLFQVQYNNFEVIIVDNNSIDESVAFIAKNYPSIIMIKLDSNKGFAEPNNIATKIAKGKYMLFLNNDTIVTPNFISELIKVIDSDENIGICQSLLLKPDGDVDSSGDFIDDIGIVYSSKKQITTPREIFSAKGASMIIRKNIFERLGGFDEKFFFSFEDVDLSWRIRTLGYRVMIIPNSIVYHLGGKTTHEINSGISFHGLKNQLSMKITNFESRLVLRVLMTFFYKYGIRELKIWFDYTIKGKTLIFATEYEEKIAMKPNIRAIFKSLIWLIINTRYLSKKHKQVNKTRTMSTNDLKKLGLISKIQH